MDRDGSTHRAVEPDQHGVPADVTDLQLHERVIANQGAWRVVKHRDGQHDERDQDESERDAESAPLSARDAGAIALHVRGASPST